MHLRTKPLAALAFLATLTGCHSHYVVADITNTTPTPITLVELDYPSASFGTGTLAPGATFHYRFKILGDGPTKLLWTDSLHQDHTVPGPHLKEGQEGSLTIAITATTPTFQTNLHP
jgi:hypothetical protein